MAVCAFMASISLHDNIVPGAVALHPNSCLPGAFLAALDGRQRAAENALAKLSRSSGLRKPPMRHGVALRLDRHAGDADLVVAGDREARPERVEAVLLGPPGRRRSCGCRARCATPTLPRAPAPRGSSAGRRHRPAARRGRRSRTPARRLATGTARRWPASRTAARPSGSQSRCGRATGAASAAP